MLYASRRAKIYIHTISDTDTEVTLKENDSTGNIYCIKLNSKGYYLTAASDSNGARVTWEAENKKNNQRWQFVEVVENKKFCWPTESESLSQLYVGDHYGIDILLLVSDTVGDEVYAIVDGVVERRFDWEEGDSIESNGSMGICLFIKHDKSVSGSGKYIRSLYMHLDDINNLDVGDSVSKGQLIGHMRHTGLCRSQNGGNGTHLHSDMITYYGKMELSQLVEVVVVSIISFSTVYSYHSASCFLLCSVKYILNSS